MRKCLDYTKESVEALLKSSKAERVTSDCYNEVEVYCVGDVTISRQDMGKRYNPSRVSPDYLHYWATGRKEDIARLERNLQKPKSELQISDGVGVSL